jgi:ABC-type protease/lipase transport system fused ATPase/permease subunit
MPVAKDHLETSVQSLNEQKHIRYVARCYLRLALTVNRKILDDRPLDLHIVHNARYNSEDVKKSPRCEPGTRARILELIHNWADQDSGLPLLWLIGSAGTGKSTLARSVIDSGGKEATDCRIYVQERRTGPEWP